MGVKTLLSRFLTRRPPDRIDAESLNAMTGAAADAGAPAPAGQRRELELTLARKILEAHLTNRRRQMQNDPADLRGVDREQAKLLIRAMAAAAHADGGLDANERARITRTLTSTRLTDDERAELEGSLAEPPCLETLLRKVDGEEIATRFYAVSLAVTERGRGANSSYLDYVAHRLKLPRDVILRLNRAFDVPV